MKIPPLSLPHHHPSPAQLLTNVTTVVHPIDGGELRLISKFESHSWSKVQEFKFKYLIKVQVDKRATMVVVLKSLIMLKTIFLSI